MKFLWQQIPSTTVSEILCNSEMDGVVLDTEHGVFNNETLFGCIQTITLAGKKCLVRITDTENKTLIRYCLDSGVDGLIFSTVETEEQVNSIIDQSVFPILGKRGYGLTRDNFWGEKKRKGCPMIIAQIETYEGLQLIRNGNHLNLVFSYFLVGPYDLASSLGVDGDFESDKFQAAIKEIKDLVGKEAMGYHIVKDIAGQYPKLKDCGFLAFGLDTLMLIDGIKNIDVERGEVSEKGDS